MNKHCQSQLVSLFPFRKVIKMGVKQALTNGLKWNSSLIAVLRLLKLHYNKVTLILILPTQNSKLQDQGHFLIFGLPQVCTVVEFSQGLLHSCIKGTALCILRIVFKSSYMHAEFECKLMDLGTESMWNYNHHIQCDLVVFCHFLPF